MIRPGAVAIAVGLFLCGCDKDPARSMKIAEQRSAATSAPMSSAAVPPPPDAPAVSLAQGSNDARAAAAPPDKRDGEVLPAKRVAAAGARTAPTKVAKASGAADPPVGNAPPGGNLSALLGCPPPPEASHGPSTLRVTGPCTFHHSGTFGCEARGDDFYITMTRKAARGAMLTMYINVEGYHGPGDYKRGEMYVGVQDKTSIHRWSNYATAVTVGPDETYAVVAPTRLDAEPIFVDCSGPVTSLQCTRREDSQAFNGTTEFVSGKMQCESGSKKNQ